MNQTVLYRFLLFSFYLILLSFSLWAMEEKEIYKNALEVNPTSEGFYVGYERLISFGNNILLFDVKNTAEHGNNFGRGGFTLRSEPLTNHVFSGRLESAWIDSHQNIGVKLAYDSPLLGLSLTGIKGISDREKTATKSTILSSTENSETVSQGSQGNFNVYEKTTTIENTVLVEESYFTTPDAVMVDLHLNYFNIVHFSIGASHWTAEDFEETGAHSTISINLTQGDQINGHVAYLNGETEGGISYKKRFNSFGDIFKPGKPLSREGSDQPLLHKMAFTPMTTPPIRIITGTSYKVKHVEVQTETHKEEILKRKPTPKTEPTPAASPTPAAPSNQLPVITTFTISPGPSTGEFTVNTVVASDPDGSLSSYNVISNNDGSVASGSWPGTWPMVITGLSGGLHTITLQVTDNDGGSTTLSGGNVNI